MRDKWRHCWMNLINLSSAVSATAVKNTLDQKESPTVSIITREPIIFDPHYISDCETLANEAEPDAVSFIGCWSETDQ